MTTDDMKSGISRIRNPVIARVFRELRLVEHWGSGIKRIFPESAVQRLPEPQIEEMATGLRLRIFSAQAHVGGAPVAGSEPDSGHQATASPAESRLESKLAAKVLLQLHAGPAGKAELTKAQGPPPCLANSPSKFAACWISAPRMGQKFWISNRVSRLFRWLSAKGALRFRGYPPTACSYRDFLDSWLRAEVKSDAFPCAFPNWDNTPRSGSNGLVIHNSSPALFRKMIRIQVDRLTVRPENQRLLFIKSWNEWAEGN